MLEVEGAIAPPLAEDVARFSDPTGFSGTSAGPQVRTLGLLALSSTFGLFLRRGDEEVP